VCGGPCSPITLFSFVSQTSFQSRVMKSNEQKENWGALHHFQAKFRNVPCMLPPSRCLGWRKPQGWPRKLHVKHSKATARVWPCREHMAAYFPRWLLPSPSFPVSICHSPWRDGISSSFSFKPRLTSWHDYSTECSVILSRLGAPIQASWNPATILLGSLMSSVEWPQKNL
jgi:hypothetical protein